MNFKVSYSAVNFDDVITVGVMTFECNDVETLRKHAMDEILKELKDTDEFIGVKKISVTIDEKKES